MRRRILLVAAAGTALAVLVLTRGSHPGAPVKLRAPRVAVTGWPSDDVVAQASATDWKSQSGRIHLRFSWLRCDYYGKHCVPLAGLRTRRIVPPQLLHIVSIRAVVTAHTAGGSTSSVSRNYVYDEAGRARAGETDLYPPLYDPAQLRHWYGLTSTEDGTDQTIVVTTLWRSPGLRLAVDRFSARYGLPLVCGTKNAGHNCFELDVEKLGPGNGAGAVEDQDIEWIHAIAPQAKIVVLRSLYPPDLAAAIRDQQFHGVHVVSASWGLRGSRLAQRRVIHDFYAVDRACNHVNVVCTFSSGDAGSPGDAPSNGTHVLAVGGTVFGSHRDGTPDVQAYWTSGGFGVTRYPLPRPAWQRTVPCQPGECAYRAVPDVSATAADVLEYEVPPGTPHDSQAGWFEGGGTSLASPLWAALIALADQQLQLAGQPAIGIDELHAVLYRGWLSPGLDDLGHRGWSLATGWGAPKAGIVDVLVRAVERYRKSG